MHCSNATKKPKPTQIIFINKVELTTCVTYNVKRQFIQRILAKASNSLYTLVLREEKNVLRRRRKQRRKLPKKKKKKKKNIAGIHRSAFATKIVNSATDGELKNWSCSFQCIELQGNG